MRIFLRDVRNGMYDPADTPSGARERVANLKKGDFFFILNVKKCFRGMNIRIINLRNLTVGEIHEKATYKAKNHMLFLESKKV